MRSTVYSDLILASPETEYISARILSSIMHKIEAASRPLSRGGTTAPALPYNSISGTAPTEVATTGVPAAIDSRTTMGICSCHEGNTNTAALASKRALSSASIQPGKSTWAPMPSEAAAICTAAWSPSPASTRRAPGHLASTDGKQLSRSNTPFLRSRRPMNRMSLPGRRGRDAACAIGLGNTSTLPIPQRVRSQAVES